MCVATLHKKFFISVEKGLCPEPLIAEGIAGKLEIIFLW